MTSLDIILTGIHAGLRDNFIGPSRLLLGRNLKSFHPTTDTELNLGLALDTFLAQETGDPLPLREAYLATMVEQGFDLTETARHLDTLLSITDDSSLW